MFFFQAFIGGESSPSQTCPFLGRLPSGMSPGTVGISGCPLPENPGPAGWSRRDITEPLKASPPGGRAPPWGSAAFPCPIPAPRPVPRPPAPCPGTPQHTHLGPLVSQPQRRRVPPAAALGEEAARSAQGMEEPREERRAESGAIRKRKRFLEIDFEGGGRGSSVSYAASAG